MGNLATDVTAGIRIGIRSYGVAGTYGMDAGIGAIAPVYESLDELTAELFRIAS